MSDFKQHTRSGRFFQRGLALGVASRDMSVEYGNRWLERGYEGEGPPWYRFDELGDQAREAGQLLAVRCRSCGMRWEYERVSDLFESCLECDVMGGPGSPLRGGAA